MNLTMVFYTIVLPNAFGKAITRTDVTIEFQFFINLNVLESFSVESFKR